MTRTKPDLSTRNFLTTPAGRRLSHDVRFNVHQDHIHGGSGFELETSSPEAGGHQTTSARAKRIKLNDNKSETYQWECSLLHFLVNFHIIVRFVLSFVVCEENRMRIWNMFPLTYRVQNMI
ncbi:hypothetical protein AVEN_131610-1 [Araneus ventricosus]|uniref:Uncharacterized protein n=1 Tax=Araneus ventricosus TaxID=182803 RepID=A0A4Y2ETM8_ARAVE|nr:hypothetical protein AVEN_131610-1 [Araneus ventricosus]